MNGSLSEDRANVGPHAVVEVGPGKGAVENREDRSRLDIRASGVS
jgi:hypothetical protein